MGALAMRPPAIPLNDALGFLAAAQALLVVLGGLVVVRKLRRDRRERASLRRRAEFAAAIARGSSADLLRIARVCLREGTALEDLLYVLESGEPLTADRRAELLDAARRARLVRRLRRSLTAGKSTRRGVAALALSALRLPGGEARVARLIADPDPDVRLAACSALAAWATPAAAAALISALGRVDLPAERIVEKLGGVWAAPTVHAALRETMRRDTRESGSAQDHPNRVQLIRALELVRLEEAQPELLTLLAEGDLEEQIGAARALGSAGSRGAVAPLIAALGSNSWPLRAQAARALGRLGAVEAIPHLAARLSDPAWWVRKQAGRALVTLGPAGGYRLLERALHHEDRYARDRAAEELRLAALARHGAAAPMLAEIIPRGVGGEVSRQERIG